MTSVTTWQRSVRRPRGRKPGTRAAGIIPWRILKGASRKVLVPLRGHGPEGDTAAWKAADSLTASEPLEAGMF